MASSNILLLSSLLLLLSTIVEPRKLASTTNSIDEFLNPQNVARAQLGLPPLQWSNQLVTYAKEYVQQRRSDCALVHSTGGYGENLFWGEGKQWTIADAVKAWSDEKSEYDYNKNACVGKKDCRHYTQMVWRESKSVGCVRIACNSKDTYIVCEYDPRGNVVGEKPF